MKNSFLLLTLLLLAFDASAQELDARSTGFIEADVSFTSSIKVTGTVSNVELKAYAYPEGADMRVTSDSSELETDSLGNKRFVLKWDSFQGGEYSLKGTVRNNAVMSSVKPLPFPYDAPLSMAPYLESTDTVLVTDEIRGKAVELVAGSKTSFEAVARLSHWVSTNVEYDASYFGRQLSSEDVFDARRGVCAEFTTLFLALARSIGIPARYVAGVVYGPGGDWEYHAWAEVYLDGWVPVDPTWNEVGWLDATHIRLGAFKDGSDVLTTIKYFPSTVQVQLGQMDVDVDIKDKEEISQVFTVSFEVFPKEIGLGDSAAVKVRVENDSPGCLATSTEVHSRVDSKQRPVFAPVDARLVALCKGEALETHFLLEARDDLPPNAVYFDLADVRTFLGNDATIDLKINPQSRQSSSIDVLLEGQIVAEGDRIPFQVKTSSRDYRVYSDLEMDRGELVAGKAGTHYIIAVTAEGDAVQKAIEVRPELDFRVKNVSKPTEVDCGESFDLSFEVENARGDPDFEVSFTTTPELESIPPREVSVPEGETVRVTASTSLKGDCSQTDQFITIKVNDQVLHEKISVKAPALDVSGTVELAVGNLFYGLEGFVSWLASLLASLLKALTG